MCTQKGYKTIEAIAKLEDIQDILEELQQQNNFKAESAIANALNHLELLKAYLLDIANKEKL